MNKDKIEMMKEEINKEFNSIQKKNKYMVYSLILIQVVVIILAILYILSAS